ncbi:MAG: alpha-hydroxyketone-type quorum-sensing autoinducer synthase [Burkholderiales bacterium]
METITKPFTEHVVTQSPKPPTKAFVDPPLTAHLQERIATTFNKRRDELWGGKFFLDGKRAGSNAVRLDGNDYLGVSGHPEIVAAQIAAMQYSDEAVIQSAVFLHASHPTHALERSLANWVGKEDSFICQSGYAANTGLLQTIADPQTPVYVDAMAHASLWEGIHAARATGYPFRHNNPDHLNRLMAQHGAGVVVVDSVYSTTGAVCPLLQMVEATERHGGMILVDESHSLGTHGPGGTGLCAELGLSNRVHFITASLAKAFAGRAGFFTMPSAMRNYITFNSFPTIFSSCLLPHEIAGLAATLAVIKKSDAARRRLHAITKRLRASFTALGYPVHQGTEQIIALEAGAEPDTMKLRDRFEEHDVFGAVFCAPATSRNRSLLRLTVSASLTDAEVSHVEATAAAVAPLIKPWDWPIARRARGG